MVSGKYSVLAGAIAREQSLANISANLANVNTTGYKQSKLNFESLLRGEKQIKESRGINYSRVSGNHTDFSSGPIRQTGNPLDIAIQGEGFFKLQGPNGTLLTKRGDFILDPEGIMRTRSGLAVLDDSDAPVQIPDSEKSRISINSLGEISTLSEDGNRAVASKLAVVRPDDMKNLKKEEHTTYSLKGGALEIPMETPLLVPESLEDSNVNMTEEMARMINSLRTFETYHKVLKSYSTLGQKQDELGTIS